MIQIKEGTMFLKTKHEEAFLKFPTIFKKSKNVLELKPFLRPEIIQAIKRSEQYLTLLDDVNNQYRDATHEMGKTTGTICKIEAAKPGEWPAKERLKVPQYNVAPPVRFGFSDNRLFVYGFWVERLRKLPITRLEAYWRPSGTRLQIIELEIFLPEQNKPLIEKYFEAIKKLDQLETKLTALTNQRQAISGELRDTLEILRAEN